MTGKGSRKPDDEYEVQDQLRLAIIIVLVGLVSLIVVAVVLGEREDATLLLGLVTILLTAALALFGIQLRIWNRD